MENSRLGGEGVGADSGADSGAGAGSGADPDPGTGAGAGADPGTGAAKDSDAERRVVVAGVRMTTGADPRLLGAGNRLA